jgi:hypothetical protein
VSLDIHLFLCKFFLNERKALVSHNNLYSSGGFHAPNGCLLTIIEACYENAYNNMKSSACLEEICILSATAPNVIPLPEGTAVISTHTRKKNSAKQVHQNALLAPLSGY